MSAVTTSRGRPSRSSPYFCKNGIARNTAGHTPGLGRSCGTSRTSRSDEFTPSACSSRSARPVARRATATTSGTSNIRASARSAIRIPSRKLVPGGVRTLIVSVPSLKGGRNSEPICETQATAANASNAAPTRIGRGWRKVNRKSLRSIHFKARSKSGSPGRSTTRDRVSRNAASAGVTVSETTSEAPSATRYASPSGANIRPSSPANANKGNTTRQTISVA